MSRPTEYQWVITSTNYDADPAKFARWLRFDGVDDYLSLPYMGLYANGSASVVVGMSEITKAYSTATISEGYSLNASPIYHFSRNNSGAGYQTYIRQNDGSKVSLSSTNLVYAASEVHVRSIIDSGSNLKAFKDNTSSVSNDYTRTGLVTLNNTTIGALIRTAITDFAQMNLYSLIIAKSALTDAQRVKCERYAASNAGVKL